MAPISENPSVVIELTVRGEKVSRACLRMFKPLVLSAEPVYIPTFHSYHKKNKSISFSEPSLSLSSGQAFPPAGQLGTRFLQRFFAGRMECL